FKTIAFMKANKDFVVASESKTIEVKPSIAAKIYDAQIAGFSVDGAWSPAAIDVIRHSLKELGILAAVPEAKAIYNDQFVPVRFSRAALERRRDRHRRHLHRPRRLSAWRNPPAEGPARPRRSDRRGRACAAPGRLRCRGHRRASPRFHHRHQYRA